MFKTSNSSKTLIGQLLLIVALLNIPRVSASSSSNHNNQNGQIQDLIAGNESKMIKMKMMIMDNSVVQQVMEKKNSLKEQGAQAVGKLGGMMQDGLGNVKSHLTGHMSQMNSAFGSLADNLNQVSSSFKGKLKKGLHSSMGQMDGMQGMASSMGRQAQDLLTTAADGAKQVVNAAQRADEKLKHELSKTVKQKVQLAAGLLTSLTQSLSSIPQVMQKNMQGMASGLSSIGGKMGASMHKSLGDIKSNLIGGISSFGGSSSNGYSGSKSGSSGYSKGGGY